jgi:hemerythrin-like domain-containing protein
MKRERFLWPLTQGHHRALVAARNVKNRIAAMKAEEQEAAMKSLRLEVNAFWQSELKGHFDAEEEMLEVFARHAGPSDQDIARILAEHRTLEQLLQNGFKEDLRRFAELLTAHVRFEEDRLFGRIEKALTPSEIQQEQAFLLERAVPACSSIPAPPASP